MRRLPSLLLMAFVSSLFCPASFGQSPPAATPPTAPSGTQPASQSEGSKNESSSETKAATEDKRPKPKKRVKDVKSVTGTIVTGGHEVKFDLYVQKAPTLCANFAYLAKRGFWDGKEWHGFTRVIRQAGLHAIGYPLPREFAPDLTFDDPAGGLLCYPKVSDKSSDAANAVRFFITIKNQERWNLDFQIFGKVTSGLQHIVDLTEGTKIDSITVEGDVDNLLKAFDVEILQWEETMTQMLKARQLPADAIPGTPDRRTGEVLAPRPLDAKEGGSNGAPAKQEEAPKKEEPATPKQGGPTGR